MFQPRTGPTVWCLLSSVNPSATTATSCWPTTCQIASAVGLVASVAGLLAAAYFLIQALLSNIVVPGYASIIVAVMVLGGLQLLALGIIGEYVGRLHLNVNRKPQYTVRHVIGGGNPVEDVPHGERAAVERPWSVDIVETVETESAT